MTTFRADIQFLQEILNYVDSTVNGSAQHYFPSISSLFSVLEAGWQGKSRQGFDAKYAEFRSYHDKLVQTGEEVIQQLRQEILILEEIQRSSSISFAP